MLSRSTFPLCTPLLRLLDYSCIDALSLQITGWFVAIVIDGQAYELAGTAGGVNGLNGSVTQKSVSFSPTNTSFIMQTGPMDVTLTFLSPIEVFV